MNRSTNYEYYRHREERYKSRNTPDRFKSRHRGISRSPFRGARNYDGKTERSRSRSRHRSRSYERYYSSYERRNTTRSRYRSRSSSSERLEDCRRSKKHKRRHRRHRRSPKSRSRSSSNMKMTSDLLTIDERALSTLAEKIKFELSSKYNNQIEKSTTVVKSSSVSKEWRDTWDIDVESPHNSPHQSPQNASSDDVQIIEILSSGESIENSKDKDEFEASNNGKEKITADHSIDNDIVQKLVKKHDNETKADKYTSLHFDFDLVKKAVSTVKSLECNDTSSTSFTHRNTEMINSIRFESVKRFSQQEVQYFSGQPCSYTESKMSSGDPSSLKTTRPTSTANSPNFLSSSSIKLPIPSTKFIPKSPIRPPFRASLTNEHQDQDYRHSFNYMSPTTEERQDQDYRHSFNHMSPKHKPTTYGEYKQQKESKTLDFEPPKKTKSSATSQAVDLNKIDMNEQPKTIPSPPSQSIYTNIRNFKIPKKTNSTATSQAVDLAKFERNEHRKTISSRPSESTDTKIRNFKNPKKTNSTATSQAVDLPELERNGQRKRISSRPSESTDTKIRNSNIPKKTNSSAMSEAVDLDKFERNEQTKLSPRPLECGKIKKKHFDNHDDNHSIGQPSTSMRCRETQETENFDLDNCLDNSTEIENVIDPPKNPSTEERAIEVLKRFIHTLMDKVTKNAALNDTTNGSFVNEVHDRDLSRSSSNKNNSKATTSKSRSSKKNNGVSTKTISKPTSSRHGEVLKNNNPEWHSLAKIFNCPLCKKPSGNSLVSHYVNDHPDIEVLVTRLPPEAANSLRSGQGITKCEIIKRQGVACYEYQQFCYFCNVYRCFNRTQWVQHLARHTGYYRIKCNHCSRRLATKPLRGKCSQINDFSVVPQPQLTKRETMAYVCDHCNYVRLHKHEIENHLRNEHDDHQQMAFKKFELLSYPRRKYKTQCHLRRTHSESEYESDDATSENETEISLETETEMSLETETDATYESESETDAGVEHDSSDSNMDIVISDATMENGNGSDVNLNQCDGNVQEFQDDNEDDEAIWVPITVLEDAEMIIKDEDWDDVNLPS